MGNGVGKAFEVRVIAASADGAGVISEVLEFPSRPSLKQFQHAVMTCMESRYHLKGWPFTIASMQVVDGAGKWRVLKDIHTVQRGDTIRVLQPGEKDGDIDVPLRAKTKLVFNYLDAASKGYIDLSDVKYGLNRGASRPSYTVVYEWFQEADATRTGRITWRAMARFAKEHPAVINALFQHIKPRGVHHAVKEATWPRFMYSTEAHRYGSGQDAVDRGVENTPALHPSSKHEAGTQHKCTASEVFSHGIRGGDGSMSGAGSLGGHPRPTSTTAAPAAAGCGGQQPHHGGRGSLPTAARGGYRSRLSAAVSQGAGYQAAAAAPHPPASAGVGLSMGDGTSHSTAGSGVGSTAPRPGAMPPSFVAGGASASGAFDHTGAAAAAAASPAPLDPSDPSAAAFRTVPIPVTEKYLKYRDVYFPTSAGAGAGDGGSHPSRPSLYDEMTVDQITVGGGVRAAGALYRGEAGERGGGDADESLREYVRRMAAGAVRAATPPRMRGADTTAGAPRRSVHFEDAPLGTAPQCGGTMDAATATDEREETLQEYLLRRRREASIGGLGAGAGPDATSSWRQDGHQPAPHPTTGDVDLNADLGVGRTGLGLGSRTYDRMASRTPLARGGGGAFDGSGGLDGGCGGGGGKEAGIAGRTAKEMEKLRGDPLAHLAVLSDRLDVLKDASALAGELGGAEAGKGVAASNTARGSSVATLPGDMFVSEVKSYRCTASSGGAGCAMGAAADNRGGGSTAEVLGTCVSPNVARARSLRARAVSVSDGFRHHFPPGRMGAVGGFG